jgi:hypothetical protein
MIQHCVVCWESTDVSEEHVASKQTTWRCIPEDITRHIRSSFEIQRGEGWGGEGEWQLVSRVGKYVYACWVPGRETVHTWAIGVSCGSIRLCLLSTWTGNRDHLGNWCLVWVNTFMPAEYLDGKPWPLGQLVSRVGQYVYACWVPGPETVHTWALTRAGRLSFPFR